MYVVVAVLLSIGDQVPVILLLEVTGNVNAVPEQIGATCVNVGVALELIVTVIVVVLAHCPAVGVNVYVVVAVLLTVGNQVPVILLLELVGNVKAVPEHNDTICVKVGVTAGFTITVIVAVLPH